MATWTTDSPISLEEQRIAKALEIMAQWRRDCICEGRLDKFCENFGCSSLEEIARILRGDIEQVIT